MLQLAAIELNSITISTVFEYVSGEIINTELLLVT